MTEIQTLSSDASVCFGVDEASLRNLQDGTVKITGWCFDKRGVPLRGVRARVGESFFVARRKHMRPDIAEKYPDRAQEEPVLYSGFVVEIPIHQQCTVVLECRSHEGTWHEVARLTNQAPKSMGSIISNLGTGILNLMNRMRGRPLIRVGILSSGKDEMCHLHSLYLAFLRDSRFVPYVIPYRIYHPGTAYTNDADSYAAYLEGRRMRVLMDGGTPPGTRPAPLLRLEDMDVLITFLPYEGLLEPEFCRRVKSRPLCYVPYGALINHVAYGNPFYDACWKIFVDHESIRARFAREKGREWAASRCVVAGLPKLDGYRDGQRTAPGYWPRARSRDIRRVMILDHWTLEWSDPDAGDGKWLGYSQFRKYKDLFQSLPERYPQLDFVFRPHPLLFDNLIKSGLFTADEIGAFVSNFESHPNAKLDRVSQDYILAFKESDCLIASGISCWIEYLPSKNPILILEKEDGPCLNEYGLKLLPGHHRAKNAGDIHSFLTDVVMGGKDDLREARLAAMRSHLMLPAEGAGVAIKNHIGTALHARSAPYCPPQLRLLNVSTTHPQS